MHVGLSQMEGRIFRVKLHQKLTSIISAALNKGAWQNERLAHYKQFYLRKGASKKKKPQISDSRGN